MPIHFTCSCGKSVHAPDEYAGKTAKCPACGQRVVIPQPGSTSGPESADSKKEPISTGRAESHPSKPSGPEPNKKGFFGTIADLFTTDLITGLSPDEQVIERHKQQELEAKIAKELSERPKVVNCKTCGKEVSRTAPTCPHCGENAPGLHIKCPKCGSMSIATGQKGFGLGKAAIGMVLLGPAGLLGGMIGRKKVELVCQACGCKWKPDPKEFA